jgi:transposase
MAQTISALGIDIAKLVFHIVGMDDSGHIVLRKRVARSELLHFIATLPPALMGMEACGSAHYWARRFGEHGHDVRLIAPQYVKAYVKSPKNDTRDAEAICEAVIRPTMRFVQTKSEHRIHQRGVKLARESGITPRI